MSLEIPMAVASYVASFDLYEEEYISPAVFEKKIRAITEEDISRVAKMILKKENMVIVVVGPHEQKDIHVPVLEV